MIDTLQMFAAGAVQLASLGVVHTAKHAGVGFSRAQWEMLTQNEMWALVDRVQVRSVLANAINVSLAMAGLPATRLPGQYVAAVIWVLVAPCNRMVAIECAPETYDAVSASGLAGPVEIKPMETEQLQSLVVAYSSGYVVDPGTGKQLYEDPEEVARRIREEARAAA